jgi:flagellar hook assembly protein FlgD
MNWHSAASTVGYGTPGYQNSQFSLSNVIADDFTIDPEVFSPDLDGYHDYTTISYLLGSGGYVATLRIYDQAGRLERFLVNNQTLGTSGSFTWDGTDDKGAKVNVGIHIIYFELIGINGDVLQFKKPVVVGAKL